MAKYQCNVEDGIYCEHKRRLTEYHQNLMSTPTEPDIDPDTDALISNAGDIGNTITIVTTHDGDRILIPWHMLDEVSIQDNRIQSINHRHITRPQPIPPASIALDI